MKVYVIERSPIMINGNLNIPAEYEDMGFEYEEMYKAVDKLHQLYNDFPDYYYIVKEVLKE